MKKIYQAPSIHTLILETVAMMATSTETGDINNMGIDRTQTITSSDQFGVKTNTVEWEEW